MARTTTKSGISLRAYAQTRRDRGLPGKNLSGVQAAIRSGRLARSVGYRQTGAPFIADPDLADQEWDGNTNEDMRPHTGPTSQSAAVLVSQSAAEDSLGLASARRRKADAAAEMAELELAERRGDLVSAAEVISHMTEAFTLVRTRMLSIPPKAKQQIPKLSRGDLSRLEGLIRDALAEVSIEGVERWRDRGGE